MRAAYRRARLSARQATSADTRTQERDMFGIQPHTPKEAQKEKTKQNPTISNGYSHSIVFLAQKIQKKKAGRAVDTNATRVLYTAFTTNFPSRSLSLAALHRVAETRRERDLPKRLLTKTSLLLTKPLYLQVCQSADEHMYVSYLPNLTHPHMHRYRRTRRQLQYFCEFQRKSERGRERANASDRERNKEGGKQVNRKIEKERRREVRIPEKIFSMQCLASISVR